MAGVKEKYLISDPLIQLLDFKKPIASLKQIMKAFIDYCVDRELIDLKT